MRSGTALIEAMMALAVLTIIGLLMLKMAINVVYPRQWVLFQTLSDAYMTYEKSYAQRIDFATLNSSTSPWPAYPLNSVTTVEVGRTPGGVPLNGTVIRFRAADPNNLAANGGIGTATTNPANMNVWSVQSILTYSVSGRNYYKSRTVIRTQ
jgi:hypothetical protein